MFALKKKNFNPRLLIHSFLFSALVVSQNSFAAQVAGLQKGKPNVIISGAQAEGLKKGMKACVYSTKDEEVACGSLKVVKGDKALLVLDDPSLQKKIKKGFSLKVIEGALPSSDKSKFKDTSSLSLFYILTPVTPSGFDKISFIPNASGQAAAETNWEKQGRASMSLFGGGISYKFPIGRFALDSGFRYRMYSGFLSEADYGPTNNIYSKIQIDGSAMGVFSDFYYYKMPFSSSSSLQIGAGLDLDMASASLKLTRLDESGALGDTEIYSVTSSLNVISLRLVNLLFNFNPSMFGIRTQLSLLMPVAAMGGTTEVTMPDSTADIPTGTTKENATEDVKKSLNHTKGGFAAEILLGININF